MRKREIEREKRERMGYIMYRYYLLLHNKHFLMQKEG